ncbi:MULTISPECIES: MazG family protein [unclassified Pseudonocardia]|uniref:MazG family protein n=1 Tax=unclassified Pseudonocardia TaxID=2619320 RepID=UPI00094B2DB4|nr:MazG family protein [Pseudonocardia sp. Ae707_Ps1]OLM16422.1 Nucleoside triphosphate pyrophosphohydrolase MazG [Pseudonocardia sp. Ae707_Ps1]
MTAVVVTCPRRGAALPAAALPALRAADRVLAVPGLDAGAAAGAQDWDGTDPGGLPDGTVLLVPAGHPAATATGAVPPPAGHGVLDAVAVMDRLRSPGGCPWDAEQTHESLLRYLVEECYELYQSIEDGDRTELREELGDVLLQVLFHARVAAEHADAPFGIDEVATGLVDKLVGRHPHVFPAGDDAGEEVRTAADQDRRWDELKRAEKQRESSLDGVAAAQPAVALAAKLASRTAKAGLPADLLPGGEETGEHLFRVAAAAQLGGGDPEAALRTAARAFDARVRAAEKAAAAAGKAPHALTAEDWRAFWDTP